MEENNRVLLIQPTSPRINFTIPLGLAYIAAVIKNRGIEVKVIDATAPYSHYGLRQIICRVAKFKPKFVGVTVNTLFVSFAYDLIEGLKRLKLGIFAGGPHVTLFPHEVLNHGTDIAVKGEAEETVAELVDFFQGKRSLEGIRGISFWNKEGQIVDNPQRPLVDSLDSLPFPDKEVFDIGAYSKNDFELWRFGGLISSRGCIGRCTFCYREVFCGRYRQRGVDNVLAEIILSHRRYGLENFYFLDDIFTADKMRTNLLCEKIKEKLNFNFRFSCITRFDRIDRGLLQVMKRSGCHSINYGVESANPETLLKLNKSETIEEMVEKIHLTKELGIDCSINFMWGYPWETERQMQDTISLMKRLSREVSEIMPGGILIPFPGTPLYEENKESYNLDGWWLQRRKFTVDYRQNSSALLFRHYLFDDQGQLGGGGFFNLSKKLLCHIGDAAQFIAWHNLRRRHNWLMSAVIFTICQLSRILYLLNHHLGYIFSKLIFSLIEMKNRWAKKEIWSRLNKQVANV